MHEHSEALSSAKLPSDTVGQLRLACGLEPFTASLKSREFVDSGVQELHLLVMPAGLVPSERQPWRLLDQVAIEEAVRRIEPLSHPGPLMIAEGAHPEKIKRHLGHSSITVTMDVYGHLFPADDEALADRLHERRLRALADDTRTNPAHGI